ncbi:MAG: UDP-2,4-diacetamido-2,4,6-trideoxy-beta-L-altropyranose hydrolase [Marinomonas sp.]
MRAPRVLLRVDASLELASGHVMRCMTLAKKIAEQGGECVFVCRDLEGNMIDAIIAAGFAVNVLTKQPQLASDCIDARLGATEAVDAKQTLSAIALFKPDIVIVDHYALGKLWEDSISARVVFVLAIDDFTDRPHACDMLLNQNHGVTPHSYAGGVLPENCKILAGAQYALLRPEFAEARALDFAKSRRNILISMGGMDARNATAWVLNVLDEYSLPKGWSVSVVLGGASPHREAVETQLQALNLDADLLVNVQNMAELMTRADFAIGASGSTSWERCAVGLPAIIVSLAANQDGLAQALVDAKAAHRVVLGDTMALSQKIAILTSDARARQAMTRAAASITDGHGVERVAKAITQMLVQSEGKANGQQF